MAKSWFKVRLSRRAAFRSPRRRFYLFCEGGNTEPEYFRAVRTSFRNALIELVTHAGVGMPLTIATRASEKAAELKASARDSYEIDDQVWAVFDRDEHPNFADAVEICREQAASLSLVPILVLNFGLSCILRISIGWRIGIKFSEGLGNFAPSTVLMAASWLIQQNSSRRLKLLAAIRHASPTANGRGNALWHPLGDRGGLERRHSVGRRSGGPAPGNGY